MTHYNFFRPASAATLHLALESDFMAMDTPLGAKSWEFTTSRGGRRLGSPFSKQITRILPSQRFTSREIRSFCAPEFCKQLMLNMENHIDIAKLNFCSSCLTLVPEVDRGW